MAKINIEFKKGILFVRMQGSLTKNNYKDFRCDLFPIVLKERFKYIVLNLDKVDFIDHIGIETLIDLSNMVSSWNGKTSICNVSNDIVRNQIKNSNISNLYYETNNELTAIGVFNI